MQIDDTTEFVTLSSTRFSNRGGDLFEGPFAILAVRSGHVPAWAAEVIDIGSVVEDADSEEMLELKRLVDEGNARVVKCLHCNFLANLTQPILDCSASRKRQRKAVDGVDAD